jgi:hypothetical protein
MPFRPELHFFYLYIRQYLKDRHGIECERGDAKVLTIPLLEKIKKHIADADMIIADMSGRNPNVFYELGLADALGKKVVLITQDADNVPTDVQHLEFIKYDLERDADFRERPNNAIYHIFEEHYRQLLEQARQLLDKFNRETGLNYQPASNEDFQKRLAAAEGKGVDISSMTPEFLKAFLLPRIINDVSDVNIMRNVQSWLAR